MPRISFSDLPDESRVWIFGSDRPLTGADADLLLEEVDRFLATWKAHGFPLTCARDWREDRFLAIGVDTTLEGASGCSIDGMFRTLQGLERELKAHLVAGGRVFYRDAEDTPRAASRGEFAELARHGGVTRETPVFDLNLTTAGEYRASFERPASEAWTKALL